MPRPRKPAKKPRVLRSALKGVYGHTTIAPYGALKFVQTLKGPAVLYYGKYYRVPKILEETAKRKIQQAEKS